MAGQRMLCRMSELPDGGARGFWREGNDDRVFAVRQGDDVLVWLNDCPHNHRPLEFLPDRFLSADGSHIVCSAHSAHFDIRSGYCYAGPCEGRSLVPVASRLVDGALWVDEPLPPPAAG
jgi:nitrite reductase/ring-hydroxylating ferredoxin subunit